MANYHLQFALAYICAMLFTTGHIVFFFLILISLTLLFYYLYFFRRLAFFKAKEKRESQQHPVSVVVCARDEEENLAKNVPGLIFQKYSSTLQTIIVNDNSQDDSKYILQELNRVFKVLTIIELKNEAQFIAGKKYPLAVGIREAQHEILLLTDADCVPASENWVFQMQDAYEEGIDIVLGYGAYQKLPGFLNKVIRFETFHSALQYMSYALAGQPYMGVGRNLSYKKSLFLNNKGFASINHLPGGDDDLFINKVATKTNTAIVTDPAAHTLSTPKKTWKEWRRQKTRHFSAAKYYKPRHKLLLGLYSIAHFCFYPLVIATAIVYDWRYALGIFAVKTTVQFIIYSKAMKKLNEADLVKWILAMDIWMLLYYVLFLPALFKRESKSW